MEHLNFGNKDKSTLCGREFRTFTTLSVKKFLRTAFAHRGLYSL